MKIPDILLNDITGYCKANNLDLDAYIVSALRQGHTVLKYGNKPQTNVRPEPINKEVTIEEVIEVELIKKEPIEVEPIKVVVPITVIIDNEDIYQEN